MNLIIRSAKIVEPGSKHHNQIADLRIVDGKIDEIGKSVKNANNSEEIKIENLHVSEGWFDSSVSFGEPGFEERETISNGLNTAAKSGFTDIALQPNCQPVIDNQSQVNFIKSRALNNAVNMHPIGNLTRGGEGIDLAELYDMKNAGAIAYGDYQKHISNPNLLKIALQYVQPFDGTIIAFSQDKFIAGNGVANEGVNATKLGLKGIPALAEELAIARNLFLLEYTGGKMHIPTVSTGKSVELIRQAKQKGLNVSCSASVHHLVLTDDELSAFDSNFKVSPPLRNESDRKALIDGVKDGTIDMITSDHDPMDVEHKKIEFDGAANGTIGLESAFAALMTILPYELIVQKFVGGKDIFNIGRQKIAEGNAACLTFFNPENDWTFGIDAILSKSKNSAFIGKKVKGKVIGIYNNGKLVVK